jgi:flap endonuclease-1
MGTQIGSLLTKKQITYDALNSKIIAIDAFNTLYQFLSSIRQRDGTPLTDSAGNPTSHLTGLFSRTCKLREANIKPVFIFDGTPPEMKKKTLLKRKESKENAAQNFEKAKEEGNIENMKKYAQATSRITPQIVEESKELLAYMGIPVVQAASEAEAQAATMLLKGDVDMVGSQDYDSFLFGAEDVVRNLGNNGTKKNPNKTPEHISLSTSLNNLELTQEQLIDVAICIGTDFNEGIHRIGPKTALKLIKKHQTINNIIERENMDIRANVPVEEIQNFFMRPPVSSDYTLKWVKPNASKLSQLLITERDFGEKLVNKNIEILTNATENNQQATLFDW